MLTSLYTITKTVKQVLHHLGVDLNMQAKNGSTAAMEASSKGHVESIEMLHAMKADFNVRDEDGGTVIHHAASNGHTAMLEVMSRQ